MTAAMIDHVIEYLHDTGTCENCGHPVQTVGAADQVMHIETGQYRCPLIDRLDGDGFATFTSIGDAEDARQKAHEAAIQEGIKECEDTTHDEMTDDAYNRGHAEGIKQGRADYSAELNGAITVALHKFRLTLADAAERAVFDRLNDALTQAWDSVDV